MKTIATAAVASLLLIYGPAQAQEEMPFGSEDDIAYAEALWEEMEAQRLAGPEMLVSLPYMGTEPHGMMLETFYTQGSVDGHTGDLVVKRNYGPAGVTADEVLSNPQDHLGAYTIMFRREDGYDPDNMNWFWARYTADGSVAENPMGMALAGRVAAGSDRGCIACHQGAPDDMIFTSDHLASN